MSETAATVHAGDVLAACHAATAASERILNQSNLWLTVHPIQHRRLRREVLNARDYLVRVTAEWRSAGCPV